MNISELFINAATNYPKKIAIIDPKKRITFAELKKDVIDTAAYFKQKGIKKGDRVLVVVPMCIDLYRIVLALFYMGATAVFIDEWVNKKRLELCCKLADCKGFIGVFKAQLFSLFSKELRQIPIKLSLNKKTNTFTPITQLNPNSSALITFTTGSTGIPKAADRSHQFLNNQFEALLNEITPNSDDIDLPVLPIVLFINLGIGCTSVITDFKVTKPEKINEASLTKQIIKNRVNRITASPFFIKKIAHHIILNKINTNSIEKIFTGGAPVFPSEADLYIKAFPTSQTKIIYGSTEAEPISSIDAKKLVLQKINLFNGLPVGVPYKEIKVVIIKISNQPITKCTNKELESKTLNNGEIGEIVVAGKHVLDQYFKNNKAFKQNKIIVDNVVWHRTGDSGLIKNNQLFLTGRCQQLIRINDTYISPFIIENQLQTIPNVNLGTILQINNQIILVVETTLNSNSLLPHIENIQYDTLIILKKIPKDPRHHSKIDYNQLKKLLKKS